MVKLLVFKSKVFAQTFRFFVRLSVVSIQQIFLNREVICAERQMAYHFNLPTWKGISVLLYNKFPIVMVDHTKKVFCAIKEITSQSEH